MLSPYQGSPRRTGLRPQEDENGVIDATAHYIHEEGDPTMLHFTEFDVRMQEHNRRADDVNRNGWLRSSSASAGRRMTLSAVLSTIGSRLALTTSVLAGRGVDTVAARNDARSLA